MKNRIGNRMKGLGITVFLLVGAVFGNWGQLAEIRAAGVENTGIVLKQEASWTDINNYRAQIIIEVRGLKNIREGHKAAKQPETPEWSEILEQPETYGQSESPDQPVTQGQPDVAEQWEAPEPPGSPEQSNASQLPDTYERSDSLEQSYSQDTSISQQVSDQGQTSGGADAGEEAWESPTEEFIHQASEESTQLCLINYVSEYFEADTQALPEGCTWEGVSVSSHTGSPTTLTKIIYPMDCSGTAEDCVSLVIPVILRQEYRISGAAVSCPVSQDAPLAKDCTAFAGTFIQNNAAGGEEQAAVVAEAASPVLEVPASKGDFTINLENVTDTPKAGQELAYEIIVTNTGSVALSQVHMEGFFSRKDLAAEWELSQGIEADGGGAVIAALEAGETKALKVHTMLTEEQDGDISLTVTAAAMNPVNTQEKITREQTVNTYVNPLKVDFTVEKTANRSIAVPGDTITYQICIRNTGERTLHSVVSTERLLGAGIQAEFVERTGVTLNSSRTQALIPQISPGEAFALEAAVTLPLDFASTELINQVTVVSKETGNRTIQSQANVSVQVPEITAAPTPIITGQGFYQSGAGTKNSGSNAYSASSYPKTGDTSATGLFAVILLCSALMATGAFWHMKAKRKH